MKKKKKSLDNSHFNSFEDRMSYLEHDSLDEDYIQRDLDKGRPKNKSRKDQPTNEDEEDYLS